MREQMIQRFCFSDQVTMLPWSSNGSTRLDRRRVRRVADQGSRSPTHSSYVLRLAILIDMRIKRAGHGIGQMICRNAHSVTETDKGASTTMSMTKGGTRPHNLLVGIILLHAGRCTCSIFRELIPTVLPPR